MKKKTREQREADEGEGFRWLWTIGGAISAYVIAELALRQQPHYWHWIVTLFMSIPIYLVITLWQHLNRKL